MSAALWTAILAPAITSALILLLRGAGRFVVVMLAAGSALVSLVAMFAAISRGAVLGNILGPPALDAGFTVPLALAARGPLLTIAFVVALVTFCVQVYSTRYLGQDDRYASFAATVALFGSAMLLVVLSADLVLTIIGWEVMGWCSYLLIGYWSRKAAARRAAYKAFLVTRVADIGFVLGAIALAAGPGSSDYGAVVDYWTHTGTCVEAGACPLPSSGMLALAMTLLVIGVLGKSAQLPFQDWLPDAMEGPTPASALIHAATMVAAGTFVLARFSPLLAASPVARGVLGVSVALTMMLAGVLAFAQPDLKRLLAWSTVSQVAVMLSPLAAASGEGGGGSGIFHLYAHAFFKALLFLAIGWLGLVGGSTTAVALRGVARKNALVRVSFGFGLLALAGVPFVVGGMSKEHLIAVTYAAADRGDTDALVVLVAQLVTVVLTAAYATRAWLVVTSPIGAPSETGSQVPQTPLTLAYAVPLLVLLLGTVFGGLVVSTWLLPIAAPTDWAMLSTTVLLLLIGAVFTWFLSAGRLYDPATRLLPRRQAALAGGLGFDRLYRAVTVPVLALANLVTEVDAKVIDASAVDTGRLVRRLGGLGQKWHTAERPATSLAWVLTGAVVLGALGVLTWR